MRQPIRARSPALLTAAVLLALFTFPHGEARAEAQDEDQQECIRELNKRFRKVAKAQLQDIRGCIKDGAEGDLEGITIEECTTADRRGRVARAKEKAIEEAAEDCVEAPDFGATDPQTANRVGMDLPLSLIHEIFGPDLDQVIIPEAVDDDAAECQEDVTKGVRRCHDRLLKAFNSCKKDTLRGEDTPQVTSAAELQAACLEDPETGGIPDPKGKIADACGEEIAKKIEDDCAEEEEEDDDSDEKEEDDDSDDEEGEETVDLLAAFPGCSTGDSTELRACLERLVRCEVVQGLNEVDGLARNPDLFDDGLANGSCVAAGCVASQSCDTGGFGVCAAGLTLCQEPVRAVGGL